MPGITMKAEVSAELQRQLNQELNAAHGYVAMAIWCEAQNLKGFARYFSKQAGEERGHAQKFIKHLLDRGAIPALGAVGAPKGDFRSLMDVARAQSRVRPRRRPVLGVA